MQDGGGRGQTLHLALACKMLRNDPDVACKMAGNDPDVACRGARNDPGVAKMLYAFLDGNIMLVDQPGINLTRPVNAD